MSPLEESPLEEKLGIVFKNKELLQLALTHPSCQLAKDYERLEFIGDACIDFILSDFLYEMYPEADEGSLTKLRAALVSTESLARKGEDLSLHEHIQIGKGIDVTNGRERQTVLADAFESIIGALYLDQGFLCVQKVLRAIFDSEARSVIPSDPKSELQEYLQAKALGTPQYTIDAVRGSEHEPVFSCSVKIQDKTYGIGEGGSKKTAQIAAAKESLRMLQSEDKK